MCFFRSLKNIDDTIRIQCLFEAQAKKIGNSLFMDVTFDLLSHSSLDWVIALVTRLAI